MNLIRCHIENFGKLSNYDYEFSNGINSIKEENGFGKTTFANFIKAMFYGLDSKRTTKTLTDRKQYEPWQGGAFGGNIEFELDGKNYKIERFFGKKEAEDTFKVYDLSTNLETTKFSDNIGEEIFKINKEAYERSTFIYGKDLETAMNDSISAKLGNVLENENDINASEKAFKILDEAIKTYKKTGDRGLLNETINEKSKLEFKLEKVKLERNVFEERKSKNNKLKEEANEYKKEIENSRKILAEKIKEEAKIAKYEQFKTLNKNSEEAKNKLEEYKNLLTNKNELDSKIEIQENELKEKMEEIEKISKKISSQKRKLWINLAIMILSVIIAIIFLKINKIAMAISSAIAIISLIAYFIGKKQADKNKIDYTNKKQEKENISKMLETLKDLYEEDINKKKETLEILEIEYKNKESLVEKYKQENNINETLSCVYLKSTDKNIVEEEIKNKANLLDKLNNEINYNENQLEILQANLEESDDIESELENITIKVKEIKEKVSILEKTKILLETAKDKFSMKYLEKMTNSFEENLKILSGNDINAKMDINLNVQIEEKGANKELKYFSTGYNDLIYFCMRLSLIDALFEDEKPFIILDDPLVNLDELKTSNAINLLKEVSNKYQIIYFSCHESRKI